MLVRSVIYGWGFDFIRPFQKILVLRNGDFLSKPKAWYVIRVSGM